MKRKLGGNYHYSFSNVPIDDIKYIQNNRNVENLYMIQDIGYSKLETSKDEQKPYLCIKAFDENAMKNSGIQLIEGRYPENEHEILISKQIQVNEGIKYNIGDELNLDICKRISGDEHELDQNNPYNEYDEENKTGEELIPETSKTFKIVGIIQRPSFNIEPYSSPGYTVITLLEEPIQGKKITVYALYKNLTNEFETTANILNTDEESLEKFIKSSASDTSQEIKNAKYDWDRNKSLIMWEKLEFSNGNTNMLFTISAVVILIIMITSIFCIRNSFAISITEKIKQYGILSSIGATPKQIKKNVLYEAVILALIGIPLGILSGLGAIFILLKIVGKILTEGVVLNVELVFKTNIVAILISIILSSITIYLSARKSAKKASKISPIEAIRSNQDIQIKSKKLKTPKIIKKLFGIGGEIAYKNLKRNNKKYKATVISIVVSVSIFIAMTSFITYAFKTSSIYYTNYKYNFSIGTADIEKDYKILEEILKNEQVKTFSLERSLHIEIQTEQLSKHYSNETKEIRSNSEINNQETTLLEVIAVGKEEYERYIKNLGLKYDDVKDKAILVDNMVEYTTINGKTSYNMYRIYDYKKGDTITGELKDKTQTTFEIAKVTDERPTGRENLYSNTGFLVISDELLEKYHENIEKRSHTYIDAEDPDKLQEFIDSNYSNKENSLENIQNIASYAKEEQSMWLVISIFLYGFITVISLIGVTNIFNTITTNMELRQKEFANLKSIGMTKKEFNKMIRLESILYGAKSLFIGILIGLILSYLLYKSFGINAQMKYILPTNGIIISIIAVLILIGVIMKYSLNKINKQNIIETIRKDNI